MSNSSSFVIPGRALESKIDAQRQFCSGGAGPESILTSALGPWAILAKPRPGALVSFRRECGKPHARCGYGFRARRLAASRNDDGADTPPHSRGLNRPSFATCPAEAREKRRRKTVCPSDKAGGRRESRMLAAPAVPCAKKVERTRAYRFDRGDPAFPAQWFYGLSRALPGVPGLLASVAPGF
jgi:hypothetical protein